MMNLILKVNSLLPFGFTINRVLQLIIAIVFFISACGSTTYWVFKYLDNEIFVPFGLSTFRALNWPLSDFVLIFCCFYAALTNLFVRSPQLANRGCVVGGIAFIAQGLTGFYIDSSRDTREQFGIEAEELQPFILNVWFVGWGAFSVWAGLFGVNMLNKMVQPQSI
jgi:hypothetical protein